ncbi:MAG: beta-ketoacyl synthase N-terminal-like domain-containing protein, partial [bacterium]
MSNTYGERRVVVTGVGAVSGFGKGANALWEGVKNGRSCVTRIRRIPTDEMTCKVAAEIFEFDPAPYVPARQATQMDRFCHLGLWAASEAIDDAKLKIKDEDMFRIGAVTGTGIGGLDHYYSEARNLFE